MAELYSLSKVTVIITNPTFGQVIIADGGNKDSIEIRRTNEGFTKEDSADGPSVFTHNASKAGESEIILKQEHHQKIREVTILRREQENRLPVA